MLIIDTMRSSMYQTNTSFLIYRSVSWSSAHHFDMGISHVLIQFWSEYVVDTNKHMLEI